MLRGIVALLIVAIGSCLAIGASRPKDPRLVPIGAAAGLNAHSSPTSRVPGFGHIGFRVVDNSGHVGPTRCALLADKPTSRQKGMRGRHDFAGYDAMVFRWVASTTDMFTNQGVPIPLSVAWFDMGGVYMGQSNMPVCNKACPTYSPGNAFHIGLETRQGQLSHLGVGTGSVLLLGGSCPGG